MGFSMMAANPAGLTARRIGYIAHRSRKAFASTTYAASDAA
jgi:hypothetical protein